MKIKRILDASFTSFCPRGPSRRTSPRCPTFRALSFPAHLGFNEYYFLPCHQVIDYLEMLMSTSDGAEMAEVTCEFLVSTITPQRLTCLWGESCMTWASLICLYPCDVPFLIPLPCSPDWLL